jgi:hypothetical protein
MHLSTATTLSGQHLVIHGTASQGRFGANAKFGPYAVFCAEWHEYVAGPYRTRWCAWLAMQRLAKHGLADPVELRLANGLLLDMAKQAVEQRNKPSLAAAVGELTEAIYEVEAARGSRIGTNPPVLRMGDAPLTEDALRRMVGVQRKVHAIVEISIEDLTTLAHDEIQDRLSERITGDERGLSRVEFTSSVVAPRSKLVVTLEVTAGVIHWDEIQPS